MPLLEDEPNFDNRPPLTPVQYKAAFTHILEAVAIIEPEDLRKDTDEPLNDVFLAAHQVQTLGTPYTDEVPAAAKAYHDFLFNRHDSLAKILGELTTPFQVIAYKQMHAQAIVAPIVKAYAFSGLAIGDSRPLLRAAEAYQKGWPWLDSVVKKARDETIAKLDRKPGEYRGQKQYYKMLAASALTFIDPSDASQLSSGQKKALAEAHVDLDTFLQSFDKDFRQPKTS